MRDDKWLFSKLDEIWDNHFPDMPQENDVRIVWGRRARNRLGSIKQIPSSKLKVPSNKQLSNSKITKLNSNFPGRARGALLGPVKIQNSNSQTHPTTVITINSLFKDTNIPEYVVLGTIAHELAHYAHGFHSPIEQKYATPHAGGIVHKEMDARGLTDVYKKQKKWLKENWRNYLLEKFPPSRANQKRRVVVKWF